jgi:hypothetical protein
MSRTLQKALLVAAMASAPLVATASPDHTVDADKPTFFERIFAKMKESVKQPTAQKPVNAPQTSAQKPATAPSLDRLPHWLKVFFDADAGAHERARSTGS